MMNDDQPTQPLTDAELAAAKTRAEFTKECQASHLGAPACRAAIRDSVCANGHMQHRSRAELDAYRDRDALLAEVDRLRAELDKYRQWLDALESAAGYGNLADVVSDLAEREVPGDHAARLRAKRVASMVATVTEETAWRHQYLSDIESERDRLRTELEGWKDNAEDTLRMYDKLKAESTGTALGHLTKIERLQMQRDALVHKLGLDWGPDEFGDLNE